MTFTGHEKGVKMCCWSPSAGQIASCGLDKIVYIWNVDDGNAIDKFEGHLKSIYCINYSPCGNYLVTGSYDNEVKIWDILSGASQTLTGHTDTVTSASFSPDGKYMATTSLDKRISLHSYKNMIVANDEHPGLSFDVSRLRTPLETSRRKLNDAKANDGYEQLHTEDDHKMLDLETGFIRKRWILKWSRVQGTATLVLNGMDMTDMKRLDYSNQMLLRQCGAKDDNDIGINDDKDNNEVQLVKLAVVETLLMCCKGDNCLSPHKTTNCENNSMHVIKNSKRNITNNETDNSDMKLLEDTFI